MAGVKIIADERFLAEYDTVAVENPGRVASITAALKSAGYRDFITPTPATEQDILRCHSASVFEQVKVDRLLFETALLAAGAAIDAAETALNGDPAFANIRPPGHHANPRHNWGFCFFNNIAIALSRLLAHGKIERALILDIDLHFGDGTEAIFKENTNVVVANIQEAFNDTFLDKCREALEQNEYDMVAISAGFDRHVEDWGGTLETDDYYKIGRLVNRHTAGKCGGRCFALLEGGYNLRVLGENAVALVRGLDGANGP